MLYKLHVDWKTIYVDTTLKELRVAKAEYIKRKRAEGVNLANIEYCWYALKVYRKPPWR